MNLNAVGLVGETVIKKQRGGKYSRRNRIKMEHEERINSKRRYTRTITYNTLIRCNISPLWLAIHKLMSFSSHDRALYCSDSEINTRRAIVIIRLD